MKIFLDACIIIYWIESAEPFHSKLATRLHKIAETHPKHTLNISRLSLLECLVKPTREKDKKTLSLYQAFFEASDLAIIEIDAIVVDMATKLRANHNLRTPDAIQAASCLSMDEKHVFLTNDKRLSSIANLHTVLL